ncbi:hypothetical protein MLD38_035506 [Melastoma candidum]|uniref:Uncharacterized protein n=1 Tax=Melastoma candidum TaxID=119954 RepID=A0ACB9LHF3_9MYRT|nr:hypothetical protein MLD38_035506 [Melastoma candidum]
MARGSINQPSSSGQMNTIGRGRGCPSSNAMTGMILINGLDARALFDTGATHSFTYQKFVDKHGFLIDLEAVEAQMILCDGVEAFLAVVLNLKEELPSLRDIPVVQEFEDVIS